MLYTVTPLERVYVDNNKKPEEKATNKASENEEELKTYTISNGRVYVKKKGDHYVIDGIQSTDMSDYLKKELAPGEKYHKE
ncbi:MAG: YlzJ-like family protein [Anaerocolumna sp.]